MIARAAQLTALAAGLLGPAIGGDEPALDARVVAIEVHPERLELDGRFAYAQLLLSGTLENGDVVDVTRRAELVEPCPLVSLDDRRLARPVREGEGALRFRVEDQELRLPVVVRGLDESVTPSFVRDVMPTISRVGCNAGTCHGAGKGQNGFKLSLRGYDSLRDHIALTDDLAGRRFDRVEPERSLFLLKPTATVPHGGGQRLMPGSPAYELLLAWVEQGATYDAETTRVTSIEVLPADPVIPSPGMSQQFAVLASYDDGSVRDVTAEAFVESGDPEVAVLEDRGLLTAVRRGELAVLVRYEGQYGATRVFVMGDREGWTWVAPPEHNWIDALVYEKLRTLRSSASELCTDAEFLRRVHLDLTGLPPTRRAVRTFLMDSRNTRVKREEVIDRLIGSVAFVDQWTNRWADLLQVNSKYLGPKGALAWREWIRAEVASNTPYDRFVAEILGASGSTLKTPPAAFWKVQRAPDVGMETATHLFMGVRFSCNKCHDHPFERWTQDQHWQLAAFLSQVGRENVKGSPLMPGRIGDGGERFAYEELISDRDEGEVINPDTAQVVPPAFPFEHAGEVPTDGPRRARLVAWLTAAENPYFASSYVNRLWSYFLGVGLIEPVDDIRAGNPPTNPELLARLTEEFVDTGFDVRHVMRLICRSRTYQHSIASDRWNENDSLNYSHAFARRLPAEVIYDAVHQATGTRPNLRGVRPGTRAGELVDASVKAEDGFLDLFGRPPRESACECERVTGMSLGQALNLVNGPTLANAIRGPANEIEELVRYERDDGRVLEELYLRFLCRPPTAEEREALLPSLEPQALANRSALTPEDNVELGRRLAAWEASVPRITWQAIELHGASSAGGATIDMQPDGSLRVTGEAPEKDRYVLTFWTDQVGLTGLRLEVLPDPDLPAGGPGRAENGNFVLAELRVSAVPTAAVDAPQAVKLASATADFSQGGWPVAKSLDGDPATGWAVMPRFGERHVAVFEAAEDFGFEGGTLLVLTLDQPYGDRHTIGWLRVSMTTSARPIRYHGLPDDVIAALSVESAERTAEQSSAIYRQYVSTDREMADRIRLGAAQDLAWALTNSPAFLFNR